MVQSTNILRLGLAAAGALMAMVLLSAAGVEGESGPGAHSAAAAVTMPDARRRGGPPPTAIARDVHAAIARGDYATAGRLSAGVLAESRLSGWFFAPFDRFVVSVPAGEEPAFVAHLAEWIAASPGDPIPRLIRAQYYFDVGWARRGHHYTAQTAAADSAAFLDDMRKGLADIDAAIQAGGTGANPYSFQLKLLIVQGTGSQPDVQAAFDEARASYPSYFPLYDLTLTSLEPKWGGSIAAMEAFVERYAGAAPADSPLKLLYLSLYRDLLNDASAACEPRTRDSDAQAACVALAMQEVDRPALERGLGEAFGLYDRTDHYHYGLAIEPILTEILKTGGGDLFAGALVERAAGAMHSNSELAPKDSRPNNYVIDRVVAESWYLRGFYDNAHNKEQQALADIAAATFPGATQRDMAVADIYDDMANTLYRLGRTREMIAYGAAAAKLRGTSKDTNFVCYGYYQLRDYARSIDACTQTITDGAKGEQARYWRALAYRDSKQTDAAVRDLIVVAASEDDSVRASAAITLSMIYFGKNDIRGALDVLNKYSYLYNPQLTSRSNIAVSYNNRCYAYMKLDRLKQALQDCTLSLTFGSLPDAYRKRAELQRRLAAHESSL